MRIPVVFGADSSFAMPLGVSIASLASSSAPSDELEIHVIVPSLEPRLRTMVDRAAANVRHLEFHVVDTGQFADLPGVEGISSATYHRFLIPELVDANRVIYLDSDVLVRSSLSELLNVPLEGRTAAAARNLTVPFIASPKGVVGWRAMDLEPDAPYFNAGVLVMDLSRWRAQRVSVRAAEYLGRFGSSVRLADQEALNAVLCGDWQELDPSWNLQPLIQDDWSGVHTVIDAEAISAARADPRIVHFVGPFKPWHRGAKRAWTEQWIEVAKHLDPGWAPSRRRSRRQEAARRLRRAAHVLVRGE